MDTFAKLLEDVRSAGYGNHRLDDRLALLLGWRQHIYGDEGEPRYICWERPDGAQLPDGPPSWSVSTDAALDLVLYGEPRWTLARLSEDDNKAWSCELREGYLTSYNKVVISETRPGRLAKTPALAILNAFLQTQISANKRGGN